MSALVPLKSGGHLSAIYPQSVEEVYRLATMALKAGMLKRQRTGYGDNAVEEGDEAVLARGTMIIMQGMEIGVPPMQAVQLLAMINGRITAHSEAVPGLLFANGFKIKETWTGTEMADDWTCHIELTRPNGDKHVGTFSVKEAKQAGLWDQSPTKTAYGKTKPNDSAWFRYPKRMLKARALGFAGKDGGSDALKGIQIREEAEDMQRVADMRDVTPAPSMLEIPDIPETSEISNTPAAASEPEDMLADPDGFLARLEEQITLCDDATELNGVAESNAEMIARLPKLQRAKAAKMLKEAAE